MFKKIILLLLIFISFSARSAYVLIPMDESQTDHLKAYGVAYWVLQHEVEVDWLLNYKGGSFAFKHNDLFVQECAIRGVKSSIIADVQYQTIVQEILQPQENMDVVKLHKVPKIAVYSPKNKQPWDDAVTMALTYSEIPYDVIYDEEVIGGLLPIYDWLHLHHEDFTGQYGKFWVSQGRQQWYIQQQIEMEATANKLGFKKVSELKLAVSKKIQEFVVGGGFLFAMCSATDSYDIALAAEGIDICDPVFDGDPADPTAQSRLDYHQCFAFTDFKLSKSKYEYEVSSIDVTQTRPKTLNEKNDFFTLFDFSAKWDPVPTMLCQNHTQVIHAFMGQTTAFNKNQIKSNVLILGENKPAGEARYIHGEFGKGTWTFYGGHDPEDYRHLVGDPPTQLELHPNSPGYRLILNNILFPAAKKKKQKT